MEKIRVGAIGASPLSPGWAVAAHIPAIQALSQFELRAVSTSRRDSADAARNTFDVAAYDNAEDLIRDPAVDLVEVTVRVTKHFPIVEEALRARKMVFCEWPLGMNTAEATVLKAKADDAGVRTVVGYRHAFLPRCSSQGNLWMTAVSVTFIQLPLWVQHGLGEESRIETAAISLTSQME